MTTHQAGAGLGSSRGAQARTHTKLPDPPPRRSGRECGYEGRDELLAANRALGAVLTKLARDADPQARAAGAVIAAVMADVVSFAAATGRDCTGPARRAGADVARKLPGLERRLAAAREHVKRVRNP